MMAKNALLIFIFLCDVVTQFSDAVPTDPQSRTRRHASSVAVPPVGEVPGSENHGERRLICPKQIMALEGGEVVLHSHLDPAGDLSTRTVDVKRTDLGVPDNVVHCDRNGRKYLEPQMRRYRNRTTLSHKNLTKGVLELKISSVNLLDGGPYRFYVPKLEIGCITNLTVVPKDLQNRTKKPHSTTTGPPMEDVHRAEDETDAVKKGLIWITVVPIVAGVIFLIFLILVKLGVIPMRKKDPEPETGTVKELTDLMRCGGPEWPSSTGSGNNVQAVQ